MLSGTLFSFGPHILPGVEVSGPIWVEADFMDGLWDQF